MRILAGVLITLVVAVFVFWLLLVRAPAPATVCQHIIDVTVSEAGDSAMGADTRETLLERMKMQCIQHKKDKIQLRGKLEYASYAKCVMADQTLQAIESC